MWHLWLRIGIIDFLLGRRGKKEKKRFSNFSLVKFLFLILLAITKLRNEFSTRVFHFTLFVHREKILSLESLPTLSVYLYLTFSHHSASEYEINAFLLF